MSFLLYKLTGVQEVINVNRIKMIIDKCGLYIVATPIGNLKDISTRGIDTIKESDFIVCENPKHSLKLLNNLGIKKKLISLHDYNEDIVIKKIAHKLNNKKVVLISDAGSPLISDPGFKLVKHCIVNNISITSIPGPSSLISGLQLSGFSLNEFYFGGFFPKTIKQMEVFVENIVSHKQTYVFFVSNHKIKDCINLMKLKIGNRKISVCKELTKKNEWIFRGNSHEVEKQLLENDKNIKGEFVVIVDGDDLKNKEIIDLTTHKDQIDKLLNKFSLTDVVEIVHKLSGNRKNKVYKWLLSIQKK